jgi:hypothetical protein
MINERCEIGKTYNDAQCHIYDKLSEWNTRSGYSARPLTISHSQILDF